MSDSKETTEWPEIEFVFDERLELGAVGQASDGFSIDGYFYKFISQQQRSDGKWAVKAKLIGKPK